MEKWTDMGHGMRRRIGAPTHPLNAVGDNMANRQHKTLGEHYDMAQASDSARVAMGDSGPQDTASPGQDVSQHMGEARMPERGEMRPSGNSKSVDPAVMGQMPQRGTIPERMGSSYRITADTTVLAEPSHGPTYNQGKLVRSVMGRQAPNFQQAIQDSEY